jgi:hypothetical protein
MAAKIVVDAKPLTELQTIAAEILKARPELKPSIEVIHNSDLDEAGKIVAINIFRTALDDPWDPLRDPRKSVEAARTQLAD